MYNCEVACAVEVLCPPLCDCIMWSSAALFVGMNFPVSSTVCRKVVFPAWICQYVVDSCIVSVCSWLDHCCVIVNLACPELCPGGLVMYCVIVKLACPVLCHCEVGLSRIVSVWSWLVQYCIIVKLAYSVFASVKWACYVFFFAAVPFRNESRSGLRALSRVYKQTSVFLSDLGVHCGLQNCRMLRFLSSFWSAAQHS